MSRDPRPGPRRDPILHTHVEDCLPDEHQLAFVSVYCDGRAHSEIAPDGLGRDDDWGLPALPKHGALHAGNNECMQTWVETGRGNFCLECFAAIPEANALDDEWGLPGLPT